MKFLAAVCLMLLLAGCAVPPSDPYSQIAAGNAALQATQQAEIRHEREARERERAATQQAMETAEADRLEIERMNGEADATLTALDSQSLRLELGQRSAVETRQSWEAALYITQTMAPVQATQTAQPTMMAASLQAAQAKADQQQVIANVLPFLMLILLLGMMTAVGIMLRWLYLIVEWQDRKNGQIQTKLGLVQYRRDGTLVDRATLNIPMLNGDIPQAPYQEAEEPQTEEPEVIGPREMAIELLNRAIEYYGDDTDRVPTYRASRISSDKWQSIIFYLKSVGMVYTTTQGTHTTEPVRDVIYRLESTSPTPIRGVRNGG